nr:leucine-rich repeat protein [uncultured Treponema sp.]
MKRRYILLLSALVLFTGTVIMTGCPTHVQPESATFKKPGTSSKVQNYHVAFSSGRNGTLIADTPLPADGMVAAGSTLTFTATPDFDYEVERWTGAVPDPSDSTKATLTVTEHTTVSVTFKAKQADVTLLEIDSTGKVIKGSPELDGYLILPDTVTSINDRAFYNCRRLTGITIPDSVNKIGKRAFEGCNRLKTVIIGNNVQEIGSWAFANCARLTNLTIGTGVTSIESYVFWKCEDLITITIPDNVVSIGSNVFESCSRLTSVTIGSGVTSMDDNVFKNCNKLKTVVIKDGLTRIAARTFYECKSLTNITLPNSIREIEAAAFGNCIGLTNIAFGTGVIAIETEAFAGCTELTSVILPNSIRKIGLKAFGWCQNLKSVKFENTSGWQYKDSHSASNWHPIKQTDLADTLRAAVYLRNTYCNCSWKRLY